MNIDTSIMMLEAILPMCFLNSNGKVVSVLS